MADPIRREFDSEASWEAAWSGLGLARRLHRGARPLDEVAHFVAGALLREGFRLFHNGGMPLLERRRYPLREEIVFVPAPHADRRDEYPFAVRVHLSHEQVRDIRSRYWRPASRAPLHIASGDICLLEWPPRLVIWHAATTTKTAEAVVETLTEHTLPWLDLFEDPEHLRVRLEDGALPLVSLSTRLELVLAEFGPREARRFLRSRIDPYLLRGVVREQKGFDTDQDRVMAIAAYYHLR